MSRLNYKTPYIIATREEIFFQPVLKDCPFCGGPGYLRPVNQFGGTRAVHVQCKACGVSSPVIAATHYMSFRGKPRTLTMQDAIDEAAIIWNTRADIGEDDDNG